MANPLEQAFALYPAAAELFSPDALHEVSTEYGGALHAPDVFTVLAARLLEEGEATPEHEESCLQLAQSFTPVDALTGFDKPQYKAMNLALLQEQQLAEGGDVFYMAADVSNLRGLNLALSGATIDDPDQKAVTEEGRTQTDGVLKLFAHVMEEEVSALGGTAQFYRDGGDELSVLITGVNAVQLEEVQQRIHSRAERIVEDAGLGNIMHPKYPDRGERAGAGIACAFAEVRPDSKLSALNGDVDAQINNIKQARKNYVALVRGQEPQKNLNNEALEQAKRSIARSASQLGIDLEQRYKEQPFPFADQEVLNQQGDGPVDFAPPVLRRKLQLEAEIEQQGMSEETAELMRGLLKIYEAHDVVTGYQRHSPQGVISEGLDFLRFNPDEQMHVLVFEMQNFAGMNETLGHDGCNKMFGNLAHKINLPSDESLYYRPDGQGDRLYVFTRGLDNAEVAQHVNEVVAMTDAFVSVNGLSDLPNPRYPDAGYEGVRFVIGATQLAPHQTPGEIFEELDEQLRVNKEQHLCFDGKPLDEPDKSVTFHNTPDRRRQPRRAVHLARTSTRSSNGKNR